MGQLRSSFTTSEKLERVLDMPVIGTISRSITAADRRRQRVQLKKFFAASGALAGVCLLLLVVEVIQVGSVA